MKDTLVYSGWKQVPVSCEGTDITDLECYVRDGMCYLGGSFAYWDAGTQMVLIEGAPPAIAPTGLTARCNTGNSVPHKWEAHIDGNELTAVFHESTAGQKAWPWSVVYPCGEIQD